MVSKLFANVGKLKSTPIFLYLFHLYHSKELLKDEELIDYEAAKGLMKYNITLASEP